MVWVLLLVLLLVVLVLVVLVLLVVVLLVLLAVVIVVVLFDAWKRMLCDAVLWKSLRCKRRVLVVR